MGTLRVPKPPSLADAALADPSLAAPTDLDLRPRASLANRLRHALGLKQTLLVHGIRYRELRAESLRRALSRNGSGGKDYLASLPDGHSIPIRCTHDRVYADLMGPRGLPALRAADGLIRPGARLLLFPGGTGYLAAYLASRLSRSGSLVSLEPDAQAARFAALRYPRPSLAHEHGDSSNLAGETDLAFDAALSVLLRPCTDPAALAELWRVARRWLLLAWPAPADSPAPTLAGLTGVDRVETLTTVGQAWLVAVAHRPHESD